MRHVLCVVVCALGCGSVRNEVVDGPACTTQNTIDSCGASCRMCTAANDRETATCDGTACGSVCKTAAARCTDNSCSRLGWAFDSNMLDGITALGPTGLVLAVRNHAGNLALAIDVQHLNAGELSFRVPICLSGNIQLQTKALSATVFLEGNGATGEQYYAQGAVPSFIKDAFLTPQSITMGISNTYSAPLSGSQFANTATDVAIRVGSYGADFTGTVWIDDIKVQ